MTDAPSTDAPLTPRQEEVLQAVVERHIASGQPVGSVRLSNVSRVHCTSSATRTGVNRKNGHRTAKPNAPCGDTLSSQMHLHL